MRARGFGGSKPSLSKATQLKQNTPKNLNPKNLNTRNKRSPLPSLKVPLGANGLRLREGDQGSRSAGLGKLSLACHARAPCTWCDTS